MRVVFGIFLALIFSTPLFGFEIPEECHIKNEKPGYCSWVSLEILGRVHGIKKLENLVENRKKDPDRVFVNSIGQWEVHPKNLGYSYSIREKLNKLGVRYWMQDAGYYDRQLLKYAKTHGCVVGVKKGAFPGYKRPHAIIITHYDENGVRFFDCNKPEKRWTATKEWFDYYWTGMIVIVEKSK